MSNLDPEEDFCPSEKKKAKKKPQVAVVTAME
jgi:hypothetical protein